MPVCRLHLQKFAATFSAIFSFSKSVTNLAIREHMAHSRTPFLTNPLVYIYQKLKVALDRKQFLGHDQKH
jgi:hypothetical protein